jgi:hypothetical protein
MASNIFLTFQADYRKGKKLLKLLVFKSLDSLSVSGQPGKDSRIVLPGRPLFHPPLWQVLYFVGSSHEIKGIMCQRIQGWNTKESGWVRLDYSIDEIKLEISWSKSGNRN